MQNTPVNGVININKPKGMTSHDVVFKIRRLLKTKTGHTGTLDPIAEGVLPICLGNATKISDYIMAGTKLYRARLKFGIATDTMDFTGQVTDEKDFEFNREKILSVLKSFEGEQLQIPPMFSAIKKNGKKLYELARQGISVEREPRPINIYSIALVDIISPMEIEIDVECSKGTYIRVLCNDIGVRLNSCAHMTKLIRLKTGDFDIKSSVSLEELSSMLEEERLEKIKEKIIPLDEVLSDLKKVYTKEHADKFLINGNKIKLSDISSQEEIFFGDKILVYSSAKILMGVYSAVNDENFRLILKPDKMLL